MLRQPTSSSDCQGLLALRDFEGSQTSTNF